MSHVDPKRPTRQELAEFLPTQRAVKAFEKLFDMVPSEFNSLEDRIGLLENPLVIEVSGDYQAIDGNYNIIQTVDNSTITLPEATAERVGRIWWVTMDFVVVIGGFIETTVGDTFPAVSSPVETRAKIITRGSTVGFRCASLNKWVFA